MPTGTTQAQSSRLLLLLALFGVTLSTPGCTDSKQDDIRWKKEFDDRLQQVEDSSKRLIADQKSALAKSEATVLILGQQVAELSDELAVLKEESQANKSIMLKPSEKGFNRLDSANGTFMISCEDVVPYLDGHKVVVKIGNPSTATYRGFTLTTKWGKPFKWSDDLARFGDEYSAWQASQRTKELSFTEELNAGEWNKVTLILVPSTPEELGHIELRIHTNTITLGSPRR